MNYYPPQLLEIPDTPKQLFYKTNLTESQLEELFTKRRIMAIVGTRRVTTYGREVTTTFTKELVKAGFVIVSGLAYGVDTIAHQTTLENEGTAVVVLGTSVDHIYPRENTQLYHDIVASGGVILSEVPVGKVVQKWMFAARNRIITGLSEGVLITEATMKSGSLITARMALEQGKDVFAIPGPINSQFSEGTNFLIKEGARPVERVEDIIEELQRVYRRPH